MNDQISGDNHGEGRKASTLFRFIPGGRFWGFYSASPISIKVAVVLCGMFLASPVSNTFSTVNDLSKIAALEGTNDPVTAQTTVWLHWPKSHELITKGFVAQNDIKKVTAAIGIVVRVAKLERGIALVALCFVCGIQLFLMGRIVRGKLLLFTIIASFASVVIIGFGISSLVRGEVGVAFVSLAGAGVLLYPVCASPTWRWK